MPTLSAPATITKKDRDDEEIIGGGDVAFSEVLVPGALPKSADNISKSARALLLRLLERNPQYRLKSLRQIQQSAFYMNFNFEEVKTKKISLKSMLEQFETKDEDLCNLINNLTTRNDFEGFDQKLCM